MSTVNDLKRIVKDWNTRENLKWLKEQRLTQHRQALDLALELRDELFPILAGGNYHPQIAPIRTPLHIRPIDYRVKNGELVIGFELLKTSQQRILPYELNLIASRMNQDLAIDIAPLLANPNFFPFSLLLRQPQIINIQNNSDAIAISVLLH